MGATLTTKTRSRGRRTGGTYRAMAEINVTPLVDVMLVLLIVFMVAAPLMTAGVKVDLPQSNARAINDDDSKTITIFIDKAGKVYIEDTEIDEKKMLMKLTAMTDGQPERRIYVRGDRDIDYGTVMRVMGTLNGAGFSKVALVTEQSKR